MTGSRAQGAGFVLLAAAGFTSAVLLAEMTLRTGVGVVSMLATRFTLAAVVLWALVAVRRIGRIAPRTVAAGLVLGGVVYAAESGLFFTSLTRLDAGVASLIAYVYPTLVAVGAVLMGREHMGRRRGAALAAATVGVALVVVGGGTGGPLDAVGVALALGAAAGYAAYILLADAMAHKVHPLALAALVTTGCAASFGAADIATGFSLGGAPPRAWVLLGLMALASTVLPIAAFLAGSRRLGPSTASILMTVEPPLTAVSAMVLFGDHLGPVQWAGAGLVLAGVLVLRVRRASPDRPPPAPA